MTRHDFDALVLPQDFQDTYFPAFESCAIRGNASGLMCSYNSVNHIPSCANSWLLTTNLREAWGFYGYITRCGELMNSDQNNDIIIDYTYLATAVL